MVTAVLLLQLAAATPLESARTLLDAGDTAAAAAVLEDIATGTRLAPDALAAFALLEWMERGAVRHDAIRSWRKLRDPHVRLRRDVRRGAVLLGDRAAEAVGDALLVQQDLEDGKPDSLISFDLDPAAQPDDWRHALDTTAAALEPVAPMVSGGIRWLLVRGYLRTLDRAAAAAPFAEPCDPHCLRLGSSPAAFRLLTRFQEAGLDTTLGRLGDLLTDLDRAPWPFNALGARAHVTLCALVRLTEGAAGCWPEGSVIEGRDGAEVEVMVHAFRGRHSQAWPVMEAHPEWFAALDSLRDPVDPPPGRRRVAGTRYAPSAPPPARDPRIPVDLLWHAAWPLYVLPYNERLVVHRARLLLADVAWRLAVGEAPGLFYPVGDPERLVAAGVPLGVAIAGPRRAILAYYPIGTHETAPRTSRGDPSLPLDLALVATGSRGTRITGFASEHYDAFGPLDHQVVQYVRDGRRQVDLHTAWRPDPMCQAPRPLLALFLLDDRMRELRRSTVPDPEPGKHLQLRLTLHPAVYVYSLELYDPGCRRAERARYVLRVPPAEGALLSDLVLADELHYGDDYRGADRLRDDRQPVTIRPSLDFVAGGTARFYWEIYGITADTLTAGRLQVTFEVVNVREERVAVRDLGRVARDAAEARPSLDVSYVVNAPPGDAPLACGLAVGLPAEARGVHVARLTVTDNATGRSARAERAFFVRG